MEIVVPPEMQAFVQRQISSGKYTDSADLVLAALQLLRQQEDLYQGRLFDLQRDALVGWDALQRGDVADGEQAIADIRKNLRARYQHPES
jgi:antitoxin ParD1/3/4